MNREYRDKYVKLAQTLGPDSLAGLVRLLVPRVREALQRGDEHLNTIPLGTWDAIALDFAAFAKSETALDAYEWPHRRLRQTASDPSLPWHRAPHLSLAERVCVLKFTAKHLAREVA